jgi:hypothetical protein
MIMTHWDITQQAEVSDPSQRSDWSAKLLQALGLQIEPGQVRASSENLPEPKKNKS